MPLQNRVTPFGAITAAPWRGAMMGNRGILHDDTGRLGTARWRHQNWVCCALEFRGRHRHPMPPGRYTALFFWDEAAALAAGHRPCGECRRAAYRRFMDAFAAAGLPADGPRSVDRHLHAHRVTRRREQIRHQAATADLPDGTFVMVPEGEHMAMLLHQNRLWHLSPEDGGYLSAGPAPRRATVLTPAPTVAAMRAGYRPQIALDCP